MVGVRAGGVSEPPPARPFSTIILSDNAQPIINKPLDDELYLLDVYLLSVGALLRLVVCFASAAFLTKSRHGHPVPPKSSSPIAA